MPKRTKADKWIYYFERFRKLPEFETPGSVYDEMTFRDDYYFMKSEDRHMVWNYIDNLKHDKRTDPIIIKILLDKMYKLERASDKEKYTDPIRTRIDKITVGSFSPILIDLYQTINTVPYILLDEFLSQYKIYSWLKFKELNLLKVKNPISQNILVTSNVFDDIEKLEEISLGGINDSYEIEFRQYRYKIDKYFVEYGPLWHTTIYKNIQAYNNFLFCPVMLSSIVDYLLLKDVLNIKGRITEIENQLNYINGNGENFTIPMIINKNLKKIKETIQLRHNKFLK